MYNCSIQKPINIELQPIELTELKQYKTLTLEHPWLDGHESVHGIALQAMNLSMI